MTKISKKSFHWKPAKLRRSFPGEVPTGEHETGQKKLKKVLDYLLRV
jgi:hypothetical protein